jgi:hypothetical protein
VLLAIGLAFAFQSLAIAVQNLASRYGLAIVLMYLVDIAPVGIGFGILMRGKIRIGWPRAPYAAAAAS